MAKARNGQLEAKMNTGRMMRAGVLLSVVIALAGCDENGKFNLLKPKAGAGAESAGEGATRRATRTIEKDVEAPQVFHIEEKGLWDGRPSLGGVWVAHPSVKQPERVMIRNKANGKSVIGALFRREMANPGPKLQVSSDAAEALGLIAGQPTELDVVALKRVEVPVEEPAPAQGDEGMKAGGSEGEISETALDDPIASAAAAIEEASGKSGEQTGTRPTPRPDITAAAEAAGVSTPGGKAGAAPAAAGSAPTADQGGKPASALPKPFIQIGIFSVEQNARNTATSLKTAGLTPVVKRHESQGKIFWRVLVGPAASKADLARMLKEAKALGFADAYPVRN